MFPFSLAVRKQEGNTYRTGDHTRECGEMRKPESNEGKEAHQETSLEGLGGDGTGSYAENGDGNGSSSVMAQAGNNVANEKGEEEEVDNDETEPHGWNGASDGQREELTDPSTGSRLVSVIQSRLDKAAAGDPEVRARECADMYEDVSGELSPRSLSRLVKEGVDVAAIKSAQATLLECPEGEPLYFYELLAQYLEHNFTEAKGLVSTCVSLWGNPHAASTYTLLLHRCCLSPILLEHRKWIALLRLFFLRSLSRTGTS